MSSKETVSTAQGGQPDSGTLDSRNRKVFSLSPPRNYNMSNLPPLLTNSKDGTIQFQSFGGRDPYGFGSSSARGGMINPLVKKNDSALNINTDLIKVAADKVRELDLGSRGSQESLLSLGERADRYISYKSKRNNRGDPRSYLQ